MKSSPRCHRAEEPDNMTTILESGARADLLAAHRATLGDLVAVRAEVVATLGDDAAIDIAAIMDELPTKRFADPQT